MKSQNTFHRTKGEFKQIISLYARSVDVLYDEEIDQAFLVFPVSSRIEMPKYNRWLKREKNTGPDFRRALNLFYCYLEIEEEDILKLERIELIPNASYLKKIEDAELVNLEGKPFLKNRRNPLREICFIDQGSFFRTIINTDLLIWSNQFEHLNTIENIYAIKDLGKGIFQIKRDDAVIIFQGN